MPTLNWTLLTLGVLCVTCPFTQAQEVPDCPRYCSCFRVQRGVSANCNYQRLASLKDMVFPADTFYLDFSFNTLSEIKADEFPDLPSLTILKIEECQVGSIDMDSFTKVPNLQNLTLNGNQIQSIHKDAFRGLRSLRHLFLEKNNIAQLDDGLFDSLELEQLYLTENNIQQITAGTFSGLFVSDLRLGGNKLSSLKSEMLQPIKERLTVFMLDNNEVPLSIDIDTFSDTSLQMLKLSNSQIMNHAFLKNVASQTLDLGGNTFENLDFSPYVGQPGLTRVQNLVLSNMGIENLEEKTLSPFQGITNLDLSVNEISRLNGDIWKNVPNLVHLDLMENPIRRLHYSFGKYLTRLNTLILKGCQLAELTDPEPFSPMTNLQTLDVIGNKIQIIGHQMEPILNRLRSFLVDSNRFHCNCEMLWLYDWIVHNSQFGKFVVKGFDFCSSPGPGNLYIWGQPKDEFVCMKPTITHIIGSSELDHHANGNGTNLDVAPGTTLMLQCSGQGDPAPVLQWHFPFAADEVVVEPGSNRTVLRSSTHYQLTAIRPDQSGQYKCIASNVQGTTEAYIQVNVREDLTLPHTPGPPVPPTTSTTSPTQKTISTTRSTSTAVPTTTTSNQKPDLNPSEKPTSGNQVLSSAGRSDANVKLTVLGVGASVIIITIIVLVVVVVYVYKARKRVYQRTYDVQNRLGDAKYPGVDGMTNGDVQNGHTPLERLDSEVSTKSTTPFGLSHA